MMNSMEYFNLMEHFDALIQYFEMEGEQNLADKLIARKMEIQSERRNMKSNPTYNEWSVKHD